MSYEDDRNDLLASRFDRDELSSGDEDDPLEDHHVQYLREDEQFCQVSNSGRRKGMRSDSSDGDEDEDEVDEDEEESEEEDQQIRVHKKRLRGQGILFPPLENAPPLRDFVTMMTAFVVAVIAAYFSVSL